MASLVQTGYIQKSGLSSDKSGGFIEHDLNYEHKGNSAR